MAGTTNPNSKSLRNRKAVKSGRRPGGKAGKRNTLGGGGTGTQQTGLNAGKDYEIKSVITTKKKGRVRIISWNMQGASSSKPGDEHKTKAKIQTITEVLRKAGPDVFLLQEVPGDAGSNLESELKKSIKKKNLQYTTTWEHDKPDDQGQRYMAIYNSGRKVTASFGDFERYDHKTQQGENQQTWTASGRLSVPVDRTSVEEEAIGRNPKKPRRVNVTTNEGSLSISTWHAEYGQGRASPIANNQYGRYLSGKSAAEKPDIIAGDLNIKRKEVKSTYSVKEEKSIVSGNLDHILSLKGSAVSRVSGLPTKQNLRSHYGFAVSDHSMIAADIVMLPKK